MGFRNLQEKLEKYKYHSSLSIQINVDIFVGLKLPVWYTYLPLVCTYLVYAWQSAGYKMFGCKTFISVKVKWKNALKLVLTAQSALVQQWPTGPSLGPVLWRHATARAPQWGQNLIEIAIKYSYYFNITISRIFVCNSIKTLRINILWNFAAKFSQISNFFMDQLIWLKRKCNLK